LKGLILRSEASRSLGSISSSYAGANLFAAVRRRSCVRPCCLDDLWFSRFCFADSSILLEWEIYLHELAILLLSSSAFRFTAAFHGWWECFRASFLLLGCSLSGLWRVVLVAADWFMSYLTTATAAVLMPKH